MWVYKRMDTILREFETREELADYLKRMDSRTEYNIRYWYVENYYELDDLIDAVADCRFKDVTKDDLLDDALDALEWEFKENVREEDDDLFGIYYKEE